jgi:hypothetical protein
MIDDASAKVSGANAGKKSRTADCDGHGAVNSGHDRASGPAQGSRPEDEHCHPQKLNDSHAARAKRLYSW